MRIAPHGRELPEDEHQRRLAAFRQGMNDREIAASVGVSKEAIASWRQRTGLGRVNNRKRKRKDDKYHQLIRCNDPLPPDELVVMKKRLRELFNADW
jgi:transposase